MRNTIREETAQRCFRRGIRFRITGTITPWLIAQIAQETDRGQQEAYYEQAKALVEQIYGQTLKGAQRRRLEEVYGTYFN